MGEFGSCFAQTCCMAIFKHGQRKRTSSTLNNLMVNAVQPYTLQRTLHNGVFERSIFGNGPVTSKKRPKTPSKTRLKCQKTTKNTPLEAKMHSNFDALNSEIAGLATRLEQMERDRAAEKMTAARTPGGLLVPKTVSLPASNHAHLETAHNALVADMKALRKQVDGLLEMVAKVARVQAQHQASIEELSLMARFD